MKQTGFVVKSTSTKGVVFFTASSAYDRPRWVALSEATVYRTEGAADRAAQKIRTRGIMTGAEAMPISEALTLILPASMDDPSADDEGDGGTTSVQSNVFDPVDPSDDGADYEPTDGDNGVDDDRGMPPDCEVVGNMDPSCSDDPSGDQQTDDSDDLGDLGDSENPDDSDGLGDETLSIVIPVGESSVGERSPKVVDLSGMDDEDAYDETQINDDIHDGDVLKLRNGVAVLCKAWPVLVAGHADQFHKLKQSASWATFDGGVYLPSVTLAKSLYQQTPGEEAEEIIRAVEQDNRMQRLLHLQEQFAAWSSAKSLDPQSRVAMMRFIQERKIDPSEASELAAQVKTGTKQRAAEGFEVPSSNKSDQVPATTKDDTDGEDDNTDDNTDDNDSGVSDVVSAGTADGNIVAMSTSPVLSVQGFLGRLTGEAYEQRKEHMLAEMRRFKMPGKPANGQRADNATTAATSKIPVRQLFSSPTAINNPAEYTQIANSNFAEKVAVPAEVSRALSDQISEYDDLVKQGGNTDKVTYCMTVAGALRELQQYLAQGTIDGIRKAQVAYGSFSNLFTMQIPAPVVKFITSGGRKQSLRDVFDQKRNS